MGRRLGKFWVWEFEGDVIKVEGVVLILYVMGVEEVWRLIKEYFKNINVF